MTRQNLRLVLCNFSEIRFRELQQYGRVVRAADRARACVGSVGRATKNLNGRSGSSCKASLERWNYFTCRPCGQNIVGEATGNPVVVYQRIDQAGQRLPLDDQVLGDTDTMMIFGLDHMITEQEASPAEIEAVRKFLTREGTCLMIGPHHDVGVSNDPAERQMEYAHHGDPLVPRQQRFGLYTRSLMKGLGVPVENRWGLRPARSPETNQIAPLTAMRDLDKRGWLTDVTTFNFHPHLPHYALTTDDTKLVRVLARQPVDMTHPPPFTESGKPRIQYIPLDAAERDASRRYFAG